MQQKKLSFYTLMVTGLIILPRIAVAQSVDYTGLESVFGKPVTTSATGQPQKVSDVPVNMEIITADDIRRSGTENLPQILGRLAGVINWQQTRSNASVGIHGQNMSINPSLLVLVNGRQVYTDIFGQTQWDEIPVQLEEIKQIEVVKGPNTALFGFNAASGVVNIVTYNPHYDDIGDAGIKVGSDGYRKLHFLDTLTFSDAAHLRVSGGMKEMNRYDNHSKTNVNLNSIPNEDRIGKFNLDGVVQLAQKTQLRLEAGYNHYDADLVGYYLPYYQDSKTTSLKSTLTSDTDYGLVDFNLYQNHLDGDYGSFLFDNRVTVAQLQDMFRIGNDHTLRLTGEYRNNTTGGSNVFGYGSEITTEIYAASGMWNWRILPGLELTNAVRYDTFGMERSGLRADNVLFPEGNEAFNKGMDAISVNSGLVWNATKEDSFRLSFARGVLAPSQTPMATWLNYLGIVMLQGNPNLQPTYAHNYELGYDRKIRLIDGSLRSSLYYRQTRDIWNLYTDTNLIGSTPVLTSNNIGDSDTIGIDLILKGKIADYWAWDVNYAFQHTKDDLTRSYDIQSLNYQDTVPKHIVNAHLGWAKGPWEIDGFAQAASSFKAMSFNFLNSYDLVDMDHYFTSGGRIAYTFDQDITLALSGVDISQARVANNPSFENERQLFFSISKKF